MQIQWSNGVVTLQSPDDLKCFKIVIDGAPSQLPEVRRDFEGVAKFDDSATAWVDQTALRAMGPRSRDAAWQLALDAMIEMATPHGWVDEATGAIKAHVEWPGRARPNRA